MLGRAATRCRQAVRLAHSSGIAISAKSAKPSPTKLAVVERYAARVFAAVEDAASDAQNPADKLRALCSVYRQALTDSDRICLCGMLGAESCGLPDKLAAAVAAFFEANIDWIAKSLPKDLPPKTRRGKAAHILATLQGAMIVAGTLKSHKVFDDAVADLLEAVDG
jgi:TetR/AcrR family transcriptional regulator, transcriptional repressor for nem operon